jgi:hypothetical protein
MPGQSFFLCIKEELAIQLIGVAACSRQKRSANGQ